MRSILVVLVTALLFALAAAPSKAYLLNGLDYSGGYGNYSLMTYNEALAAIAANGERVATKSEVENLFEHFNFSLTSPTSNSADFDLFEEIFGWTYCTTHDPQEWIIDSFYESNPSISGRVNLAYVSGTYYDDAFHDITTQFYSIPLGEFDDPLASCIYANSAWTVREVPEPATMLLFVTGLSGLAAVGRKRS